MMATNHSVVATAYPIETNRFLFGSRRIGPVTLVALLSVLGIVVWIGVVLLQPNSAQHDGANNDKIQFFGEEDREKYDPNPFSGQGLVSTTVPWRRKGQTMAVRVLGETKFARMEVHSVALPNKNNAPPTIINDWLFMEEGHAVNVAIQSATDQAWLVMETSKYAIPGTTYSPVGGFVDPEDASPYEAAKREVMEELGVGSPQSKEAEFWKKDKSKGSEPGARVSENELEKEFHLPNGAVTDGDPDWVFLGRYRTAANRGGGFLFCYMLRDAIPLHDKQGGTADFQGQGDLESQNLVRLSTPQLQEALLEGRFQEVKWTATFALALQYLHNDENKI